MTLLTEAQSLVDRTNQLAEKAEALGLPTAADATRLAEEALAQGVVAAPALSPGARPGYDHLIDALNRLPRPILALTTVALFLVAAIAPTWFEARMVALSTIPEPLWWLAGAVITMFFGSREAFYRRQAPKP